MDKKIDILRKYPNCKVRYEGYGRVGKIMQLDFTDDPYASLETDGGDWFYNVDIRVITPILRPMSAMTGKEIEKYMQLKGEVFNKIRINKDFLTVSTQLTDYLRNQSIDIDGLIESKQAEAEQ